MIPRLILNKIFFKGVPNSWCVHWHTEDFYKRGRAYNRNHICLVEKYFQVIAKEKKVFTWNLFLISRICDLQGGHGTMPRPLNTLLSVYNISIQLIKLLQKYNYGLSHHKKYFNINVFSQQSVWPIGLVRAI